MIAVDVSDVPPHDPLFLFVDSKMGMAYLVSKANYHMFWESPAARNTLADIVIELDNYTVLSSCHF